MNKHQTFETYVSLFIPWLFSLLLVEYPMLSYLLAWLGSFFIFYRSWRIGIQLLPPGHNFETALLRPLFLVQVIFAGYMCCTSIFYFLEIIAADPGQLIFTAQCQRYYCLAHAAFVAGILSNTRPSVLPVYRLNQAPGIFIFQLSLASSCLSRLIAGFEGLDQFSHQFANLSYIATALALTYALKEKAFWRGVICMLLYAVNFYQALLSGFKEPIIITVMILGIFLYPHYKRTVILLFLPVLCLLFISLPTYNRIFREEAWLRGLSVQQAGQMAFSATFDEENSSNGWLFLTNRLSEINMFTQYVQSTPAQISYYGTTLAKQGTLSIIPRIFWPGKPNTEQLVMERVYKAGVIHEQSKVSAKPALVVDAYLSGGIPGIFICLFSYGALCQFIANKAEQLFGGYSIGIAVIFTGLFQIFWRGQCLEFLINAVCWSYLSMYLIFRILRSMQILKPL